MKYWIPLSGSVRGQPILVKSKTGIHVAAPHRKDELYLAVANLSAKAATVSLRYCNDNYICKDVVVDANSPPSVLIDKIIVFSDGIVAESDQDNAISITGHVKRLP